MSDEAQRTSGVFIPYPLLALILTLAMAGVAGIVGLYTQLSAMNATMILRDSDYQKTIKRLEDKIDLQDQLTRDLREKQGEMRSDVNQLLKRRGGN